MSATPPAAASADPGPPWLRHVVDYAPLAAFVVGFFASGKNLLVATGWLVGASAAAIALSLILTRRVAPLPLFTGVTAMLFGGLTLLFHDPVFLKMKLTIVDVTLGSVLVGSLFLRKNPLKALMGDAVKLNDGGWRRLTIRYAVFCFALAALNEVIWRTQPDATWVLFRMPGVLILTVLFSVVQTPFMLKDMQAAESEQAAQAAALTERLAEPQE